MSAGGFSGLVNAYANDAAKERWGSLAYIASAVSALKDVTEHELDIVMDGQPLRLRAYNVAVGNGRFAGGGIPIAPEAMLDDGLLDLVIVPVASFLESAAATLHILLGRQHASEKVLTLRARQIEIDANPDMPFNVDGEALGESDVSFDVLPRALRVVAGPDCQALSRGSG